MWNQFALAIHSSQSLVGQDGDNDCIDDDNDGHGEDGDDDDDGDGENRNAVIRL